MPASRRCLSSGQAHTMLHRQAPAPRQWKIMGVARRWTYLQFPSQIMHLREGYRVLGGSQLRTLWKRSAASIPKTERYPKETGDRRTYSQIRKTFRLSPHFPKRQILVSSQIESPPQY